MYPLIPPFIFLSRHRTVQFSVDDLPQASAWLAYGQRRTIDMRYPGVFRFSTESFASHLHRRLSDYAADYGQLHPKDAEFLKWLRAADLDNEIDVALPSGWEGIEIEVYLAVIKTGKYSVRCQTCGQSYASADVVCPSQEDRVHVYDVRACPRGHVLSDILLAHVLPS